MKKYGFLLTCLFLQLITSAQVNWLNPTPSGWANTKIHFVNESTGFLMNSNGDLFISRDTGNSWKQHGSFPASNTFAMNGATGIIPCFDGSIYISKDYGETWLKTLTSPGTTLFENWAAVVGEDTLFVLQYVSNYEYKLFKSTNFGTSWEYISTMSQFAFESMDFISTKHAFVRHPNGIFKSTNGGVTWQQVFNELTSANVTAIKFYDTLRGVAYRESYGMMRTYDGGVNWSISNEVTDDITDIFYVDSLNLFAIGEDGVTFKSTNGGINWTWVSASARTDQFNLYSQYFFSKDHGIVTGTRGRILTTKNGGTSWDWHAPTYIDITSISFGDSTTGYATIWNNLYKTTNAGKSWQQMALTATGYNKRFEHSRFTSKDTGFVSSNYPPQVQYTTDGGTNWMISSFPNAANYDYISSLSFYSKDSGYAAVLGSTSGLFKTSDGGKNWQQVGSPQRFNVVYFLNDMCGYGTRWDFIYRTLDGGLTWTVLGPPSSSPYTGLWFKNAARGITVGDQGQMRMTIDSGKTWNNIFLEPFQLPDYKAIAFYNDTIGYTTDDEGQFYKTIDGGLTWYHHGSLPYETKNILFRPDSSVLFAGINGAIVTRPIAEYAIDSVKIVAGPCSAQLQAKVKAFFSPVDSVWFEYGTTGYTNRILSSPNSVNNSTMRVSSNANNLQPEQAYHFRVRVRFRGAYYYSGDHIVIPAKAAAPVITANGNVLRSSATEGNQWYFNNVLLPGAVNQEYSATSSGTYSVTALINGCPTLPSSPYVLSITSTTDLQQLLTDIKFYPNPVSGNEITLFLNSNRSLHLQLQTMNGVLLFEQILQKGNNSISLNQIPAGIYILTITDRKTFNRVEKKLVRL